MKRISTFILATLIIAVAFMPSEAGRTLGQQSLGTPVDLSTTTYSTETIYARIPMRNGSSTVDGLHIRALLTGPAGTSAIMRVYPSWAITDTIPDVTMSLHPPAGAAAATWTLTAKGTFYVSVEWGVSNFNQAYGPYMPPFVLLTITESFTAGTLQLDAEYFRE